MAKILVADDEADLELLIKQKFRHQIKNHLYEFIFAVNGNDALNKIQEHPDVDIVLSDINMPEMDGLTLLSKLGESSPLIKSVIVSAYGDMENIRTAMNRGAFDFITKPINFEDLELTMQKTIQHAQHIRDTFKAIKENNILKMYVDETVLNFMGGREFESSLMVNETIDASVAFIDICSFTSISEQESPDTVIQLLNHYFDVMVKEIIRHGGYIDKFIGDAIMAVFRGDNHMQNALDACIAVRNQVETLPDLMNKDSFKLKVSIGVNCGEMISGNIGSASLKRLDYTVIGDNVNIAQRLQAAAGPDQILINEKTYSIIKDKYACIEMGEINFKNKLSGVNVYQVLKRV